MEIIDKDEIITLFGNKTSKKNLENYYINEKKSMNEISRICGCDVSTIKRKLKKYEIPIRSHGAFLVDDDGKSLNSKRVGGEITQRKYEDERIKIKGYKNPNEYNQKMLYERGMGSGLLMSENKECTKYLGVHICENKEFLSKIINIVESMPENNPGYDVVCVRDKKVDVKCACLTVDNSQWSFNIDNNKIADYFLMISFNDRENLSIMHIWLVKGDSVIEKTTWNSKEFIVNEMETIHVGKGNKSLKRWKKYEKTDILDEAQKICDSFKNDNR